MKIIRMHRRSRGFTAAELSAVAAIIAILALIVIPIFRDRVDEARRVGTLDDLQGLAKAVLLADADTGRYPRLNDLDNGINITEPSEDPTQESPIGQQNSFDPYTSAERNAVRALWKGPYAAFQNNVTFGELASLYAPMLSTNNGPIRVFAPIQSGALPLSGPTAGADHQADRYPADHYGNPYIFSAPGIFLATATGTGNESEFSGGVIYSMGPDGLPGDGVAPNGAADPTANPLRRESGVLGTGDDLYYIF